MAIHEKTVLSVAKPTSRNARPAIRNSMEYRLSGCGFFMGSLYIITLVQDLMKTLIIWFSQESLINRINVALKECSSATDTA